MSDLMDTVKIGSRRHPAVHSIEDVITFKLARFVGINERLGHRWSETKFDLSLNEWRMLALVQAYAQVRAGDLAELMLMDKSQLSRLIKSLQAKKTLKSKPDPHDARAVVLSLSTKGEMLYDEVLAEVLCRNENVLAPLSDEEISVFDGLLTRLVRHNEHLLALRMHEQGS